MLPKPAELTRYEMVKATGLPLVRGGLLDQPHIWLMQWEVIEGVLAVFRAQDNLAQNMKPVSNLMAPMRLGK